MESRYPGIGIIGNDHISALYGVDNGIVDWQGTGIQHFFYGSFQQDLIHTATTYIQHASSGEIELANRLISKDTHPVHQHPYASTVEEGFCYSTTFQSQVNEDLFWTEKVYATNQDQIVFETTIKNESLIEQTFVAGGYIILRNPSFKRLSYNNQSLKWENDQTVLHIIGEQADETYFYKESPTGFVYRTLQQTLNHKESDCADDFTSNTMIGIVTKKSINLEPGKEKTVRWMIQAGSIKNIMEDSQGNPNEWERMFKTAKTHWKKWLDSGSLPIEKFNEPLRSTVKTNLIALKASLLDGFVPADITGHYYSNGSPSYYVRDSLMIAKAFLNAGFLPEAKSIITYAAARKIKEGTGEFYQRYNALGQPSEGANNNVFHQYDSQGYFLHLVERYFEETNEWIVPFEQVKDVANVLFRVERKNGLFGPEGGVNEGVFGPAYITSSNMFITGGLLSASRIAFHHHDAFHEKKWKDLANSITEHIETETWLKEQKRYGYGYVLYADELVQKYDTPQYFGPLYGYPVTENFKSMVDVSLKDQSFFDYGIGYSEQEYHHGPWIFNTAANAQCQVLVGNKENFIFIIKWMLDHSNAYGLFPEAIDANSEDRCFINPLTWACAEFISAIVGGQCLLIES
ncbi:hypothetical protein [Neobacillus terrae]|uniref:hypothetical protein n=1 Tax=Neobacillus terrae TaxID=3034837 RepID=UPI00140CE6EA|nr:hypothetical protein [Neobacillus terrae]NHM33619.1 hypothetical protein [Neobacillus terrae]